MDDMIHPADLDQCVTALDEDDRRTVCAYWERIVGEELPTARRVFPLREDGRRKRRGVRRAAPAGRRGRVLPGPTWPGEAA